MALLASPDVGIRRRALLRKRRTTARRMRTQRTADECGISDIRYEAGSSLKKSSKASSDLSALRSVFNPVTRSTLNELHRVGLWRGRRRRLARIDTAGGCGVGCASWLDESQRFAIRFHGIDNHRRYLLAPRCFRINRRSATVNA